MFSSISEPTVLQVGPTREGNLWQEGVLVSGLNSATGCCVTSGDFSSGSPYSHLRDGPVMPPWLSLEPVPRSSGDWRCGGAVSHPGKIPEG